MRLLYSTSSARASVDKTERATREAPGVVVNFILADSTRAIDFENEREDASTKNRTHFFSARLLY